MPWKSALRAVTTPSVRRAGRQTLTALAAPVIGIGVVAARASYPRKAQPRAALILAPAVAGSFGDEAMMLAAAAYLHRRGFVRVTVASYGRSEPWRPAGRIDDILDLGRDFQEAFSRCQIRFLRACRDYTHFYAFGADMMDGYYSPQESIRRLVLANHACQVGLASGIVCFSFNREPHPDVVRHFRRLSPKVHLAARDPLSHARLSEALGRSIECTADVAFLLEPNEDFPGVRDAVAWISSEQASGRLVVGLNANYLVAEKHTADPVGDLVAGYARAVALAAERGPSLSFIFLPHDRRPMRGVIDDFELAARIRSTLPDSVRGHTYMLANECGAAEVKAIVRRLDAVVAGRMHLAIACVSQGIPAGAVTYQGKFEGMFRHFGIEGVTLSPQEALKGDSLAELMAQLIKRHHEIRAQVAANIERVRGLAAANFGLNRE